MAENRREYKTEAEEFRKIFEIMSLLDGWPLGQALSVLKGAEGWLEDTHTVNVRNARFALALEEAEAFCREQA